MRSTWHNEHREDRRLESRAFPDDPQAESHHVRGNLRERIAVVGLGYAGLPIAVALASAFPDTLGFDIDRRRVEALRSGNDATGVVNSRSLTAAGLTLSDDESDLDDGTFYIIAVPTPVDGRGQPDLTHLERATETVGRALRPGSVVVVESTVYPGVTEEICGPILSQASGLQRGKGFKLAYSPERVNPGDVRRSLGEITKVIAAEDGEALERVAAVYGRALHTELYRAPSIRVAEAAKVVENCQRDINIALMNELALIFDRAGLSTREVIETARTKWNFAPFNPGLVGGHCVGVDPLYLISYAREVGHDPQLLLEGRRVNDEIGAYVGQRTAKLLARAGAGPTGARVGILGITYKANVADFRNSRVPDIVAELEEFGVEVIIHDPVADPDAVYAECGIPLSRWDDFVHLDGLVYAVDHDFYRREVPIRLGAMVRVGGAVVDVNSALDPASISALPNYWSL